MSSRCKFGDGPANGKGPLMLRGAPVLLRVVVSESGNLDVLESDHPAPGEKVYVYVMVKYRSRQVYVRLRHGGVNITAEVEYRLHDNQPDESILHSASAWAVWSRDEQHALAEAAYPFSVLSAVWLK